MIASKSRCSNNLVLCEGLILRWIFDYWSLFDNLCFGPYLGCRKVEIVDLFDDEVGCCLYVFLDSIVESIPPRPRERRFVGYTTES